MSAAEEPMLLSVSRLSAQYSGGAVGVQDISLDLARGQTIALVGPNGGGKTSTLRAIAGFLRRDAVTVHCTSLTLDGVNIARWSPRKRAKLGLALVPERDKIFTELTVLEQLKLSWAINHRGPFADRLNEAVDAFPEISKQLNRRGGYLSGGQRQMVALATAICASPRVLIVDEVTLGLAPALVERMATGLRQLGGRDMGLLIAEQSMALALEVADRLLVMDAGRVVAQGSPGELRNNPEILAAYIGQPSGRGVPAADPADKSGPGLAEMRHQS
jgi:branched-chain amino acid transport system ATP-binding protein